MKIFVIKTICIGLIIAGSLYACFFGFALLADRPSAFTAATAHVPGEAAANYVETGMDSSRINAAGGIFGAVIGTVALVFVLRKNSK